MKRIIFVIFLFLPLLASSQNMYNITSLLEKTPSGTARFVSMGGSMGALGGDLSVMGTNPAGTAIYRSSDINLAGVFDVVRNNAVYEKTSISSKYNGADLSNLGFVVAFETENSLVKYVNFGANFRRKANICDNFEMLGAANGFSQQYVMDYLYSGKPFDVTNMEPGMYSGLEYNWLALLAADAGLCDDNGNFLSKNNLIFPPAELSYYSDQRGSLDAFDINMSANINDVIYVGATVGYHKINYSRFSYYEEKDELGNIYSLKNDYSLRGSGFDFKLGTIIRPFRYSPFKIAAYIHTPVLYNLVDTYSASIDGPYESDDMFDTSSEQCNGEDFYVSYSLMTPWKIGAAISYTFGRRLALNAEYEYDNASATNFTGEYDVDVAQNEEISYNLKAQHTIRLGAELSLGKFALRAGYNYISSPFDKEAYKCIDNATVVDTSTEYMNRFGKNVFTFGGGYAGKYMYFDIAYMCQVQNAEFYPFYDMDYVNPAASVATVGHSIMAGVGIRF